MKFHHISRRDFFKVLLQWCCAAVCAVLYIYPLRKLFATSSMPITHKVLPGETLWEISRKYNVSVADILSHNNIEHAHKIRVNQLITIPVEPEGKTVLPITDISPQTEPGIYHHLNSGETLWDLSRRYGVPVKNIIEENNIISPHSLRIGQKIFIPMTQSQIEAYHSLQQLRETIRQDIAVMPGIKRRAWKYIVLHHSATHVGNARAFNEYHSKVRHMENGLAYHFVIDNGRSGLDGKIEIGGRWQRQIHGGHVKSNYHNQCGIGICLVGNFEDYAPTKEQYKSMTALVQVLQEEFRISPVRIIGHRDIPREYTLCPGRHFPMKHLKQALT
ncbi:LysM peptidoglycan-binding domain-containing protein [bacterium]|nr:LysM peptidoglycan-binding domain-containing protein [bacterium]